jgi:peptidoglycan/xylan/chitin deacetylase (PgdA/CDA1 family)
MRSLLKQASRAVLHNAGGLELFIRRNRRRIAIVTFHHFASDAASLEELDQRCAWIKLHFTPVTLDQIADALDGSGPLPENPITITVDDGYRDFLVAHPIFKRHGLHSTVFLVSGFLDGECWLWVDIVQTLLMHSPRTELVISPAGGAETEMVLPLFTIDDRKASARKLTEAAKQLPDEERRRLIANLPELCGSALPALGGLALQHLKLGEFPDTLGAEQSLRSFLPLTWDEVRELAAAGVTFGAHTHTHPILSRVTDAQRLADEIRQPKDRVAAEVGRCNHFCYPNGGPGDISEAAVREVEAAGYRTAVTTSAGLNERSQPRYRLLRVSTETQSSRTYFYESLAGLHSHANAANEY